MIRDDDRDSCEWNERVRLAHKYPDAYDPNFTIREFKREIVWTDERKRVADCLGIPHP